MALQCEPVLPLAADPEGPGDVVRRGSHVRIAVAERHELRPAEEFGAAVACPVGAEGSRADAFNPAGEVHPVSPGGHQPRGEHDGVQAGAALPVHGDPGNADRQAGLQGGQAGNIAAASHGIADHHIRNGRRRQAGAFQEAAKDGGQELGARGAPSTPR